MSRLVLCILLTLSVSAPFSMRAKASELPPDVVHTNDGGMVRGLIIEIVPNEYVILQTPSGEVHRYGMDDVKYAGAAANAPALSATRTAGPASARAPSEAPRQAGPLSRVRLFSEPEGLTLHRLASTGSGYSGQYMVHIRTWEPLCTAPCEMELARGLHTLVLEDERGKKVGVKGKLSLRDDADLELSRVNRRGARLGLILPSVALIGSGIAMLVMGTVGQDCTDRSAYSDTCYSRDMNPRIIASGAVFSVTGIVMMIVGISRRDYGKVVQHPYGTLAETR